MFYIRQFLTLLINPFSFKKNNLKYFSLRRVIVVLTVMPSFTLHLIINWIFLLLDEILFPRYRATPTRRIVFIISIPRSATTFLHHKLLEDEENFHGARLWELIFAPSICQKYFYLAFGKLSKQLGYPIRSMIHWLSRKLLKGERMEDIHRTGLHSYEEDELLFLWNLSSAFYYFFFPQTPALEKLMYHDRDLPEWVKKTNFSYYKNCIRRHNYVFDRKNERYYVSKNPMFMSKIDTVAKHFPDARFLYPLRTPLETIPSTISLMAANFAKFSYMYTDYPLQEETRNLLIYWYQYGDEIMKTKIREQGKVILYTVIARDPIGILNDIYLFLSLPKRSIPHEHQQKKRRKHESNHEYNSQMGIDRELLRKELGSILSDMVAL